MFSLLFSHSVIFAPRATSLVIQEFVVCLLCRLLYPRIGEHRPIFLGRCVVLFCFVPFFFLSSVYIILFKPRNAVCFQSKTVPTIQYPDIFHFFAFFFAFLAHWIIFLTTSWIKLLPTHLPKEAFSPSAPSHWKGTISFHDFTNFLSF